VGAGFSAPCVKQTKGKTMNFKRRKEDKQVDAAREREREEREACRCREVLAALKNTVSSPKMQDISKRKSNVIVVAPTEEDGKDDDPSLKMYF
jgi:nickel-dependent lactate racemase